MMELQNCILIVPIERIKAGKPHYIVVPAFNFEFNFIAKLENLMFDKPVTVTIWSTQPQGFIRQFSVEVRVKNFSTDPMHQNAISYYFHDNTATIHGIFNTVKVPPKTYTLNNEIHFLIDVARITFAM